MAAGTFTLRTVSLALLSAGAGVMDGLSFLRLGHVFTSAMTGNAALLGLAIGQLQGAAALRALSAFAGFALGAAAAAVILGRDPTDRRLAAAFFVEAVFLAAFGVLWVVVADRGASGTAHALILLSSFGMGVQGSTVRHFDIPGVTTTVFTTTLVSIMSAVIPRLTGGSGKLPHSTWQQIGVMVAYGAGAAIAGVVVGYRVEAMGFLPFAAVVIVLVWDFVER